MKTEIQQYIRSIRNPEKKNYAMKYAAYLAGDYANPPYHDNTLSYMGAQAVRMRIDAITSKANI